VVGEAAEDFDKITDRTFYGLAGGLEYRLTELISLGVNVEANWKDMSAYHLESVRMTAYSVSALVRLSRNQKRTPYIRGELGRISASWSGDPLAEYVDIRTSTFGRVGFGMFQYGSSKTSARFELYYKRALSESDTLDNLRGVLIDSNPSGVGLEFALMFSVI
jgi:hypothetical protein